METETGLILTTLHIECRLVYKWFDNENMDILQDMNIKVL